MYILSTARTLFSVFVEESRRQVIGDVRVAECARVGVRLQEAASGFLLEPEVQRVDQLAPLDLRAHDVLRHLLRPQLLLCDLSSAKAPPEHSICRIRVESEDNRLMLIDDCMYSSIQYNRVQRILRKSVAKSGPFCGEGAREERVARRPMPEVAIPEGSRMRLAEVLRVARDHYRVRVDLHMTAEYCSVFQAKMQEYNGMWCYSAVVRA